MTDTQQDAIRDKIREQAIKNFGSRELHILNGLHREIREANEMNLSSYDTDQIYEISTMNGQMLFYFGREGNINFI